MKLPWLFVGFLCACGGTGGTSLLDDSGTGDGSTPNDGSGGDASASDAIASGDASDGSTCPSFCSSVTAPLFCSDFDNESTPADWNATVTTNGGAVAITQTQDVSCPNGLIASLPMIQAGGQSIGGSAFVTKNASGTITHVVASLEAYLPSADQTTYIVYFGVHPAQDPNGGINVTHHGDAFWFLSNQLGANVEINPAPLVGAWNAMKLDVNFGSAANNFSLTYTGIDNAVHTITGSASLTASSFQSVTLQVGMLAPGQTEAAFTAYYDNVVLAPAK